MIAPSVKGKKGGDGDGRRSGDDGDVDGTTSSGDVDSERVEAALLEVSICARVEEQGTTTYQCHLGHPSSMQIVRTDSSDSDSDAEDSRSNE